MHLFPMDNTMGMRHPFQARWAVLLVAAGMGCAGVMGADLAPTSPFLTANAAAAGSAASPSGPIELRGIMSTPDGIAYCIYDTTKKKDTWVGLNETGHDFVVRTADPGSDSVKVDYQGRSVNLTLRAAKVASAGPAGTGPPIATSQVLSSVSANPTPGDEQKRLDAVAQEVRRRKMERERASQEAQGPGGIQPPVPNR